MSRGRLVIEGYDDEFSTGEWSRPPQQPSSFSPPLSSRLGPSPRSPSPHVPSSHLHPDSDDDDVDAPPAMRRQHRDQRHSSKPRKSAKKDFRDPEQGPHRRDTYPEVPGNEQCCVRVVGYPVEQTEQIRNTWAQFGRIVHWKEVKYGHPVLMLWYSTPNEAEAACKAGPFVIPSPDGDFLCGAHPVLQFQETDDDGNVSGERYGLFYPAATDSQSGILESIDTRREITLRHKIKNQGLHPGRKLRPTKVAARMRFWDPVSWRKSMDLYVNRAAEYLFPC